TFSLCRYCRVCCLYFLSMQPRSPTPTPFPYTTLFRSTYTAIHNVLTNPVYAGAYVYGKTRTERFVDASGRVGQRTRHLPRTEWRSEEHTSELQSRGHLVCRLLLEKKKMKTVSMHYILS